jgi:hypothetical protein
MMLLIIDMTINRERREAAAVMGTTMRLVACVDRALVVLESIFCAWSALVGLVALCPMSLSLALQTVDASLV